MKTPDPINSIKKPIRLENYIDKDGTSINKKALIYAACILLPILTIMASIVIIAYVSTRHTEPAEIIGGSLATDLKTGCQYVTTLTGITPRMNADGTQTCLTVQP
ncbi:hypothetical protein [Undibacterium squillarum]|uniref:Uncharacterized protein n=1 Tax=Undibacterium squillarum TaxID=1131567 RepID=A0ABQ2Y2L8_9BURK|nr:hypothetical protein [Undibacterium squillarum]GGX53215.1 hypothetical protein GCM10010946_34760 [Undibacterium squillarum]